MSVSPRHFTIGTCSRHIERPLLTGGALCAGWQSLPPAGPSWASGACSAGTNEGRESNAQIPEAVLRDKVTFGSSTRRGDPYKALVLAPKFSREDPGGLDC